MSMQQVRGAELSGWGLPSCPMAITAVARQFTARSARIGMGGADLEAAARRCPGFSSIREGGNTSDGYTWWRTIVFDVHGGQVAILMPLLRDQDKVDDTFLDRSPAAYTKGSDDAKAAANAVAARLARAMGDANRDRAGRR